MFKNFPLESDFYVSHHSAWCVRYLWASNRKSTKCQHATRVAGWCISFKFSTPYQQWPSVTHVSHKHEKTTSCWDERSLDKWGWRDEHLDSRYMTKYVIYCNIVSKLILHNESKGLHYHWRFPCFNHSLPTISERLSHLPWDQQATLTTWFWWLVILNSWPSPKEHFQIRTELEL